MMKKTRMFSLAIATALAVLCHAGAAAEEAALPQASPPAGMTIGAVLAGKMFSRAALAYNGGRFGDERVFGMSALLVHHPQGDLLIDAGFGRNVDVHIETTPWLMRKVSRYEKETPVAQQLAAAGIDPGRLKGVVITHAHWDHVSGLEDLPGVPVWVNQAELDFIRSGHETTELARRLDLKTYQVYAFGGPAYLGFPASHDVFGDGSVVLVPAPGHTPGSTIVFVSLPGGQRYALVGDLVWQIEGVDLPAEKPWISRRLVDFDQEATRALVQRMHELKRRLPALVVLPAHDRRLWEQLPRLR
ncbi:MBL fold metallo-hydrolase [Methylibium rhizosphaerae]|uniref:MBL fold metallo-hydrolase n=1 Tax=Methylibium rhizosphaerae TaxID=2570323 RepID=UPI00112E6C41|nr:MBL fold metallo-hydrolase [Methylibium rhizosphaerae]